MENRLIHHRDQNDFPEDFWDQHENEILRRNHNNNENLFKLNLWEIEQGEYQDCKTKLKLYILATGFISFASFYTIWYLLSIVHGPFTHQKYLTEKYWLLLFNFSLSMYSSHFCYCACIAHYDPAIMLLRRWQNKQVKMQIHLICFFIMVIFIGFFDDILKLILFAGIPRNNHYYTS